MMKTWLMRRGPRSPGSFANTAPRRSAPWRLPLLRDHGAEELVAVQTALHQQLGLAPPHEIDRHCRRCMAVRRVDDPDPIEDDAARQGDFPNARLGADEDRRDDAEPGRGDSAFER